MRVLAADIGTVRLGLAVSDPLGLTAQPLPTQPAGSVKQQCRTILGVALGYEKGPERGRVSTIVIGHPVKLDGTKSEMTERAEECARVLAEYVRQQFSRAIDILVWDERLTSVAADQALLGAQVKRRERRERRDQVAAQLILENYLESRRTAAQ